jgi:hypothetical protein
VAAPFFDEAGEPSVAPGEDRAEQTEGESLDGVTGPDVTGPREFSLAEFIGEDGFGDGGFDADDLAGWTDAND